MIQWKEQNGSIYIQVEKTMEHVIAYRHNVIKIDSLDTFCSVRGGITRACKDVCFVRALGECSGYADSVYHAEQKLQEDMRMGKLRYARIGVLPALTDADAVTRYAQIYENWEMQGKISLLHVQEQALLPYMAKALGAVMEIYHRSRPSASDSMAKNFGVKLLYWTDTVLADLLHGWTEKSCRKLAAVNVGKEQEYLFYYFATLLGCDVLLLQNKKDVDAGEALKQLSQTLTLGAFGAADLVPYEEKVETAVPGHAAVKNTVAEKSQRAEADVHRKPVRLDASRVKKPPRAGASAQSDPVSLKRPDTPVQSRPVSTQRPDTPVQSHPVSTQRPNTPVQSRPVSIQRPGSPSQINQVQTRHLDTTSGRQEKSFEELAMLASSVVMIAVHDETGEVTGTGSGIMIGRKGFILTNHHVIAGGRYYSVRIEDDEQIYSTHEIIKDNYHLDLAVIRIQRTLTPIPVYKGPQKLVRGQKVVAIGSPLGMFNSVSDGIVSGFRRIDEVNMIQFTAPTSPGSSGGAVLNMYGEVIGISTAGMDRGQNINLAVRWEDICSFARGFYE